jgi:hypothetical protein
MATAGTPSTLIRAVSREDYMYMTLVREKKVARFTFLQEPQHCSSMLAGFRGDTPAPCCRHNILPGLFFPFFLYLNNGPKGIQVQRYQEGDHVAPLSWSPSGLDSFVRRHRGNKTRPKGCQPCALTCPEHSTTFKSHIL